MYKSLVGRCDVRIPFSCATQSQANDLYLHFFAGNRSSSFPIDDFNEPPNEKLNFNMVAADTDHANQLTQWASLFAACIPEKEV